MKQILLILFLLTCVLAYSQQIVTLSADDMPVSGNSFEYNQAQPTIQFNASQTGNNYTWDFTSLQSTSSSTDSFLAVIETPLVYNLSFNLPFDPNRATVANNLAPLPSFGNIPLPFPITFSNKNSFYRTEAGVFKQVGYAFTADYNSISLPLPVKYTNPDEIYTLPLEFGQNQAPTQARYEFQIPGLITFIENSTRTNTVDGQGLLQLPNGSFNALRIKSELLISDSTYIDTLNFWLPVPPRTVIEYKWVSANHGWPLLEISGQQTVFPVSQFQVTNVKYLKLTPSAIGEQAATANIKVYPIPATDKITIEGRGIEELWLMGIDGKLLANERVKPNTGNYILNLNTTPTAGLYILTVKTDQGVKSYKLPIQ